MSSLSSLEDLQGVVAYFRRTRLEEKLGMGVVNPELKPRPFVCLWTNPRASWWHALTSRPVSQGRIIRRSIADAWKVHEEGGSLAPGWASPLCTYIQSPFQAYVIPHERLRRFSKHELTEPGGRQRVTLEGLRVIRRWVLDMQAYAPPGQCARDALSGFFSQPHAT